MKKLPFLIFFIFIFLFIFFIFVKPVSATILLQDDFESGNLDQWTVINGSWSIKSVMGSNRYGTKIEPKFTIAETQSGDFSWTDYQFEVEMTSISGEDKNLFFRSIESRSIYDDGGGHIYNWPQGYGLHMSYEVIRLYKFLPGGFSSLASKNLPFPPGTTHLFKIILMGNNIKVYANENLLINYTDIENPVLQGRIALAASTGASAPTEVYYDNVLVTSIEPSPTPTPTVTPTSTPLQPLIFLPGLGASWNHEAMILGATDKKPEDWYMTPGVKSYDGIIQTFQNAGYIKDENFFVFNYDWRKPVDEINNDLKEFLSRHPPPVGTEIDLVGHSLGGLVARTYIQKNPKNQVDQLLTLGSPHKGAVKTYYLWEGAQLNKGLSGWQRIGAGILLQLKKKNFENNVETIQHVVPVLKDILPTFPYLKINGVEKPISEMKQKNNWLESLNQLPLPVPLISILNTIVGVKENSTLRWINIQERNKLDQLLGKWVDGKPVSEENATGDDAVLNFSASLDNAAHVINLPGFDHGDLVETIEGQQAIIDLLGLSPSEIIPAPEITYEPSLVFEIASPANITVFDPNNNLITENQKLVFIPNPILGNYKIEVNQEGSGGHYRLLIGNINSSGDTWTEEEGETNPIQPQVHIISYNPDPLQTRLQLIILAKEKLNEAKVKAQNLKKPVRFLLVGAIEIRIQEVDKIISLLNQKKTKQAQIKTQEAILSISILEKNFKFWAKLFKMTPEDQEEFRILFRQAKDYLVQAYELE